MNEYDTATPYIASYLILRKENKIAFLLRANTGWMNGRYGLPSGKVEKGEGFLAAAVREAEEEVGIKIDVKDLIYIHTMHRYTPSEGSDWVDVFFEPTKYEGEPYNAEDDVHSELVWLDPKNLPEIVVPSVKFAVEKIENGELYSEFIWPEE